MRSFLMIAYLALAATPAVAQTTNCSRDVVGDVQCKTTPSPTIQERQSSCEVGGISAVALGCTIGEVKRAKAVKAQREEIGALIAAGRCEEAKNIPLKSGDFDMAERVQRLCTPKP